MNNEFIIKIIKDSKGKEVALDSMSIEAADALKLFIQSLSDFAKLHDNIADVKLSLKSGCIESALAYPETDSRFDEEIQAVVNGESDNKANIKLLKIIQDKIKANGLEYSVSHKIKNEIHDLTPLFKSKDFVIRRSPRSKWHKDVLFVEGNLYEAGGKTKVNIHVEDKSNFHYTIDCSREQAQDLKLFDDVYLSILRKYNPNHPLQYELLDFYIKKDKFLEYKKLYENLGQDKSLERFDFLHDKIISILNDENKSNGELLKIMRLFNYSESDRGMVRTILMALKRVKKDEKLTDMYNSLANILRDGNKNNII